jgi:superfamily I DNA/RNA helicase
MLGYVEESNWQPIDVPELEPSAREAVSSSSNCLVVAGPGAGKTELLAQRANFLFRTGKCPSPHQILAISFKRDAANNLGERVRNRCMADGERFTSLTLDAFAKSLIDRFGRALAPEWRPNPAYNVCTKGVTPDQALEWLTNAAIPSNISTVSFGKYGKNQIRGIMDKLMHGVQLPYDADGIKPLLQVLGRQWWAEQLGKGPNEPSLTFPMLNRLAAYLLRTNPKISQALGLTYSHVFLDEFQDTTAAQWDLIQAAFSGSSSILTAVGDNKQRIMVWAGALEEVFDRYCEVFEARQIELVRNYRSVPELVLIQRDIASAVEGASNLPLSEARGIGDGICSIFEFASPEQEAVFFADMISREIDEGIYETRDYGVIVRQRTSVMVAHLKDELNRRGIVLRDESVLQDIRTEPLTKLVLAVLTLATRKRDADSWSALCEMLLQLTRIDDFGFKLEEAALRHVSVAKQAIASHGGLRDIPAAIVDVVGRDSYRAAFGQYSTGNYLDDAIDRLGSVIEDAAAETGSPDKVVDLILGEDVIPAMTIHKSKGLEFETVIFLGLEDGQWWNFRRQPEEEKRAFFVAFSRAKSRVFFSLSDLRDTDYGRKRQAKTDIGDLHEILISAGVKVIDARQ